MDLIRTEWGVAVSRPGAAPLLIRRIVGVGRNYADHAQEMGASRPERPLLFAKAVTSASAPGEPIVLPACCRDREQVDYEGELAVIIGQRCRDVREDDALGVVLGYCCANDVSARWWQKQGAGGQFHRGKSFDTFCPLGPRVTPAADAPDPQALELTTRLNGEVVQSAGTSQMLFPVRELIAEISRDTTLLPGTVILTGTPAGVGFGRSPQRFLRSGDTVEVEISGLGVLRSEVRDGC
ncbi:MAG: FAA hydrolase family protein [Planctomycetota bacterium]|nr:MAG: FAA hydrolase family protein [Planctomycetota bacterium]